MATIHRLVLEGQTAYAELLTHSLARAHAGPRSTIVEKKIRGGVYLYVQQRALGSMKQTYLGPDTKDVRARAEAIATAARAGATRVERGGELVRIARAGGCATPTVAEASVIAALADGGVFAIGGTLVGTHAFAVLGNALGVRWEGGQTRTADIDLVHDPHVLVAIADHPIADVTRSGVDLWPIPGFDPREPSTSFMVRGTELHLDLLTPMRGRSDRPVHIPLLGAAARPLRFLDYLVEDTMPAVVVGASGVLVNVPTPARFALHKLIVAAERSAAFATKASKDLAQAAGLLYVLLEDRPADVQVAWKALVRRGPGWRKRARASLRRIDPSIARELA